MIGDGGSVGHHGRSLWFSGFQPHDDPQDDEHREEGGDARDDGGDPVDPSKGVACRFGELEGFRLGAFEFYFQTVEVKLLEQILSFEGGHSSFVLKGSNGSLKVLPGVIAEYSLGIPGPFEDLWRGESLVSPDFTIDLMLFQFQAASLRDTDNGTFSDLELAMLGTADTFRDDVAIGIDLDLEVAVSG